MFYQKRYGYDLNYVTKGMQTSDQGFECFYIGNLLFDKNRQMYTMRSPQMVIGTDRLELYDFLGRRKDIYRAKI